MKANIEILWLAFSILDKDYEPNITPQKRFYFNKFGKDIGLRRVRIDLMSCDWQIELTFS